MKRVPAESWIWLARPAHFIGATYCRFRLGTVVGDFIVSSVGDMMVSSTGREVDAVRRQVGCGRTHETMVFHRGAKCDCGCGEYRIESGNEIDFASANSDAECRANHLRLCRKYAAKSRANTGVGS